MSGLADAAPLARARQRPRRMRRMYALSAARQRVWRHALGVGSHSRQGRTARRLLSAITGRYSCGNTCGRSIILMALYRVRHYRPIYNMLFNLSPMEDRGVLYCVLTGDLGFSSLLSDHALPKLDVLLVAPGRTPRAAG